MVCLNTKKWYKLIIVLIVLSIFIVSCTDNGEVPVNDPNNGAWNQPDDSPSEELNPLYNLTQVPKLEKLFLNVIFIKQLTLNKIPYLYGFSADGKYVSFIKYISNNEDKGYLVQIFNYNSGDLVYTVLIPDLNEPIQSGIQLDGQESVQDYGNKIIESKNFALAKEVLEKGYNITVPPAKIKWKNNMEYNLNNRGMVFSIEKDENNKFYFKISDTNSNEEWHLLGAGNIPLDKSAVDMFSFPGKPDWVVFVFLESSTETNKKNDYSPLFIRLNNLTHKNSSLGKIEEADLFLYNQFKFIYDQWETGNHKGFVVISDDDKTQKLKNGSFIVDQWLYMNRTGRMKFYGNPEGIFNSEIKPIHPLNSAFYYNIHLAFDSTQVLKYFVVDEYDRNSKKLVRTVEFIWSEKKSEFVPAQQHITLH